MIQNHTLRVEPVTSDKQHEYWIHKQLPTSAQGMTCVHSQTNLGYFISLFWIQRNQNTASYQLQFPYLTAWNKDEPQNVNHDLHLQRATIVKDW